MPMTLEEMEEAMIAGWNQPDTAFWRYTLWGRVGLSATNDPEVIAAHDSDPRFERITWEQWAEARRARMRESAGEQ